MLGVDICQPSKKGPGYCKIVWTDERFDGCCVVPCSVILTLLSRREKSRFCNCKMLGLKNHKVVSTSDEWMLDD